MAYSINGKVYTDHPLMDEIVYNCKLILNEIVIKNDILANDYETEQSIHDAEVLMMINDGSISFNSFPFTEEILLAFGYTYHQVTAMLRDIENVPASDRKRLLSFGCNYFKDQYEETNNYYRMLNGLPPYGTSDFDVYIDETYLPSNYNKEIDFSKPLHKLDDSIIAVLNSTGKINDLLSVYKGSNYSYIKFLGDKKIDIINARKANKWDILYCPTVESLVEDRFKELYILNRDIYLKRSYQEAYAFHSDYYDQVMIIMVLAQTMNDMIVEVPEWYIRRDIFDLRSVEYFLDSYGVDYFKEIPLKYQIRIVKGLNKLIKYKSSNKNNNDILDIFSLKDTSIWEYYLFKKRKTDEFGNYIGTSDDKDNNNYDLEFVRSKIGDTYDNYIKDQKYRSHYDDITYQDKYWDGEEEHELVKQKHLERDFTIEPTKYMSVEYNVNLSEYQFQMQYFLGLILDSNVKMDDIKIAVPSLQPSVNFKVSDLFIFLFLLTIGFENGDPSITKPNNRYDNLDLVTYDVPDNLYDWMKDKLPEMFNYYQDRVYGFNTDVNKTQMNNILRRRHSQNQFDSGLSLEYFGVDEYIVPGEIKSITELIQIYNNNKKCYNNLKNKMINDIDDRDEYKTAEWIFSELFTKRFDYKHYDLSNQEEAKSLVDILADRDFILYNVYNKIMGETNIESRNDNIRNIMNDVINTLEYYINGEGLEYIFAFATTASFASLIHYIYLMINFFKSYKVYFLDPIVTYTVDDKLENLATGKDVIAEKKLTYWKEDKSFQRDAVKQKILLEFVDNQLERIKEILDIYGHFEPDPLDDYDYDGMYANSDETQSEYKDANGGYADESEATPFIMLNAGRAQGSKRDLWDINGATSSEMIDYLTVDGGYAKNTEDWRKDYWNSQFTYELDGGSASTNQFLQKSMHTKVIDRQITNEIRLSTATSNVLTLEDDGGLYIKESWTAYQEFEDFEDEFFNTFNYYESMYSELSEDILIMTDEEALNERINKCIEDYLGDAVRVIELVSGSILENELKDYTDEKVKLLYEEFSNFNPYAWGEF